MWHVGQSKGVTHYLVGPIIVIQWREKISQLLIVLFYKEKKKIF